MLYNNNINRLYKIMGLNIMNIQLGNINDYKIINPISIFDIKAINIFHKIKFKGLEKIGEGLHGKVYKYKNYAIKWAEDHIDGKILSLFQDNTLFPKLYFYNDDFLVMEYIDIKEKSTYDYFEKNIEINYSAYDIFKYCYSKGYIPYDIHDENVIVAEDRLKIIDVGCFRPHYGKESLPSIILDSDDFTELNNIINHVKTPNIAI